jgi:UDP-3-O-[3-hydroxymyristoyl] glucosamine N-acyltransferase
MVTLDDLKVADDSFHIHSKNVKDEEVSTICSLDQFHEGGLVFVSDKKYFNKLLDKLNNSGSPGTIGVVFQESFFKASCQDQSAVLNSFRFYATVESVDLALSHFSKLFYDEFAQNGNDFVDGRKAGLANVHPTSTLAENVFIGEGVEVGANVTIHAGCVILSHSKIGENTILYPNVTIYRNVIIGKNCRVHGNTTIGSDGYGYNYYQGEHLKVWHFGGVLINDSVEIGSGTSIDQGTFSPTVIGEGTKIDNQVHLAHNCKIGKGVLITGQAGFSGSVTLGDYVAMGGCAQFAPGVVVGDHAQIGGIAGVTGNVPAKAVYAGYPARPLKEFLKSSAMLRRLSLGKKKVTEAA